MNGKRLLYAGSFDPLTNGHLDLILRGAKLCGHMVIGVAKNVSKKSLFAVEERMEMIRLSTEHLRNVTIDGFDGLLADYVREREIDVVLRGLRTAADFEYEARMAHMNARLYGNGAETVFLLSRPEYSFISSGLVREVFALNGDISGFVPGEVLKLMKREKA
ncbi:MAG: pantetheine-phosphate adenylyltransferase [Clostridiales Family XIII bacterium]|jgi:pantetheine-phosphate adenylyltransferase|nr:pantetheine-phosphate adenylyltransferase [Clostridiales Family XIII bacterium]